MTVSSMFRVVFIWITIPHVRLTIKDGARRDGGYARVRQAVYGNALASHRAHSPRSVAEAFAHTVRVPALPVGMPSRKLAEHSIPVRVRAFALAGPMRSCRSHVVRAMRVERCHM
jgi:hypothetical protein